MIEVFSKKNATKLPPHRPYDCSIDILQGATLPKSQVYPLTQEEEKAMEEQIDEALVQGFIRRPHRDFSFLKRKMAVFGVALIMVPSITS